MRLMMLGAPGAGKGTQAERLSKLLNIPTISTGNILRAAVKEETPVGLKAKKYMDSGALVPDEVIIGVILERLAAPDCDRGCILDGVPRTLQQALALEEAGVKFDAVVSLEISDEAILERMALRRVCEDCGASYHLTAVPPKQEGVCDSCGGRLIQRADDSPETVAKRLEIYYRETEPLKDFYARRGLLRRIETAATVEGTTEAILKIIRY